jgi:hypothetical protein
MKNGKRGIPGVGYKTFCVWRNKDDAIIAIDQSAAVCAGLMGINLKTFYEFRAKAKKKRGRWTILASDEIESEEETA